MHYPVFPFRSTDGGWTLIFHIGQYVKGKDIGSKEFGVPTNRAFRITWIGKTLVYLEGFGFAAQSRVEPHLTASP